MSFDVLFRKTSLCFLLGLGLLPSGTAALAAAPASRGQAPKKAAPAAANTAAAQSADPAGKSPASGVAGFYTLGRINGEASNEMSVVNIRFDRKPEWSEVKIDAHGSFLQLRLPQTIVTEPGTFYDGNSPYIDKIAIYQASPSEAMVRLFTSVDAKLIKESLDSDLLDSRLVITVDHHSLAAKLNALNLTPPDGLTASAATAPATAAALAANPLATATTAATTPPVAANDASTTTAAIAAVGNALAATTTAATTAAALPPAAASSIPLNAASSPAALVASNAAAAPSQTLEGRLQKIALFSCFFFGMVLLALTGRRLLRNHRILSTPDPMIKMQTLSDLSLAPKQKLTLVQVGHERLLLAVSPDGVSLITHLPGESSAQGMEAARMFAQPARLSASPHAAAPGLPAASMAAARGDEPATKSRPSLRKRASAPSNEAGRPPAAAPQQAQQARQVAQPQQTMPAPRPDAGRRISYAIDDAGIRDQTLEAAPKLKRDPSTEKAIDDVTKLIREKLKSLPKIS